jgi:hypothetical protein
LFLVQLLSPSDGLMNTVKKLHRNINILIIQRISGIEENGFIVVIAKKVCKDR